MVQMLLVSWDSGSKLQELCAFLSRSLFFWALSRTRLSLSRSKTSIHSVAAVAVHVVM